LLKREWKHLFFYGFTILSALIGVTLGSRAVTTFAENRVPADTICIVIDPGHGGEDGGAISLSGIPESTYNLDISHRLNDLLQLMGYRTKLIRDSDVSIYTKGKTLSQKKISDLKERVRIINETENAILLSIHQNHFSDPKYSGGQIFHTGQQGSEALAKHLQALLVSSLNRGSNRKAKKSSGVYLMEHITCPGVLIECGFLSNPAEEANLRNPEYQKKLCCVITTGVSQYLSNT